MTQAVSRQKNEILYLSPQANTWKFAIYNISVFILSLRKVKGGTSTDLISTRDLSTGHRFNHIGHHRDGNEEASHVVEHLLSGSLQFFILFFLAFLFYRFDLIV